MFHSFGFYLTNTLFSNILINLTHFRGMRLLSAPPVFLKYKDTELSVVITKILAEIERIGRHLRKESSRVESNLSVKPTRKFADLLHLDVHLRQNRILIRKIINTENFGYAKKAKLDKRPAKRLADENCYLEFNETVSANLIEEEALDENQDLIIFPPWLKLKQDYVSFKDTLKTRRSKINCGSCWLGKGLLRM